MFINKQRLVSFFCDMAKIKSPSGDEETLARFVSAKLSTLGLTVGRDSYGNVLARLAGQGEPLILCAHMDTVAVGAGAEIRPMVKETAGLITSDGSTILGADNKDAIAAIVEMLQVVAEQHLSHRPLEIVLTREEEAISRGAQNLDVSRFSGRECVISDHANEYGTIVLGAPSCFRFEAKITGRRSHVKDPEQGINAVLISAKAISRLPLGRIDELTTANIAYQIAGLSGVVDQPSREVTTLSAENRNTVPDLCLVYGEVRGIHDEQVLATLSKIQQVFTEEAQAVGGTVVFQQERLSHGYVWNQNDELVARVAGILEAQEVKPRYHYAVGGSDANILNQRGIKSVVFSSAHRNNHQCSEYLIIDDLIKLSDFFVRLVTS